MAFKSTLKPFGEVALEKAFITPDQLLRALNTQIMNRAEKGEHQLIGAILLEQGAINGDQLHEVLDFCWFTRVNFDA